MNNFFLTPALYFYGIACCVALLCTRILMVKAKPFIINKVIYCDAEDAGWCTGKVLATQPGCYEKL